MDCLLKCIEHEGSRGAGADLPANDPAGEGVNDEYHMDKAGGGVDAGEINHLQRIEPADAEPTVYFVQRVRRFDIADSGLLCWPREPRSFGSRCCAAPAAHCLARAADLACDRGHRRLLRAIIGTVLTHHLNRSLADPGRKLVRCFAHGGSFFSQIGASGKPGTIQYCYRSWLMLCAGRDKDGAG